MGKGGQRRVLTYCIHGIQTPVFCVQISSQTGILRLFCHAQPCTSGTAYFLNCRVGFFGQRDHELPWFCSLCWMNPPLTPFNRQGLRGRKSVKPSLTVKITPNFLLPVPTEVVWQKFSLMLEQRNGHKHRHRENIAAAASCFISLSRHRSSS